MTLLNTINVGTYVPVAFIQVTTLPMLERPLLSFSHMLATLLFLCCTVNPCFVSIEYPVDCMINLSWFRFTDVKKPCYVFWCQAFHPSYRNTSRCSHRYYWKTLEKGSKLFLPSFWIFLVKWMLWNISYCQLTSHAFYVLTSRPIVTLVHNYAVLYKFILKLTG